MIKLYKPYPITHRHSNSEIKSKIYDMKQLLQDNYCPIY